MRDYTRDCVRIRYKDNTFFFTEPLAIESSVSVHHRNIQVLPTELYKFANGLSPKQVSDCFKLNKWLCITPDIRTLSILGLFPLGTEIWELCQMIWKIFQHWKTLIGHWTVEAACLSMSALQNLYLSGWFRLTFEWKINFFFHRFFFYLQ